MTLQEKFMKQAIELAHMNVKNHTGGPFGAIIVKDDRIIAQGINLVTTTHDPTAHAEIVAIRQACKSLKKFQLIGCTLYTSCEPCPMCLGAIYWTRLSTVYYAATKCDAAVIGFDDSYIYEQLALQHDQQKIPMLQLMHTEAVPVFALWQQDQEKVMY